MSTYSTPEARLAALRDDLANLPATAPAFRRQDLLLAIEVVEARRDKSPKTFSPKVTPKPEPTIIDEVFATCERVAAGGTFAVQEALF